MDFRTCIENENIKVISEPALPNLAVTKKLIELEPSPVLFKKVNGMQVAGNIFCERIRFAEYLNLSTSDFLSDLSQKLASSTPKLSVSEETYGEDEQTEINLSQLPILFHYPGDGGYYITSAVWIVNDPELGRNLSYHRMMILNDKQGSVRVVENRGMYQALAHTNGKAEVAICIAPPPAVLLAASFSTSNETDEMELAARLAPVELVNCKTVDLQVPKYCEIVLEGHFTGEFSQEGAFVDITGTWDKIR